MQSYYAKHPVGKVKITNTEKSSITDIEVSFFQKGYMDSPTPAIKIPELKGGESREIGLLASFNDAVFAMKAGDVSAKPVKTQFGYHVIYVEGVKPSSTVPYDEAKGRIIGMLKQKTFSAKMAKMAESLKAKAKITVASPDANASK